MAALVRIDPDDERAQHCRMALAEVGYGHATVAYDHQDRCLRMSAYVPDEIAWRAFAIADPEGTDCWDCWCNATEGCDHDPLAVLR